MSASLKLRTFRIGMPRRRGEGLRIGTVRYLPRGVRKEDYARLDYFDVWLPILAPSCTLLRWLREGDLNDPARMSAFFRRYRQEMLQNSDRRQAIELVRRFAEVSSVSIGCYCEDESRCHRSVLHALIAGTTTTANHR